jgi:hypothetical protein
MKNQGGWTWQGMLHTWRRDMHIGFWWESQKERDYWEDRHRWNDNIKMNLREIGWGDMDWIDLAEDRDQWGALMNISLSN